MFESNDHIFGPADRPLSLWTRPAVQQICALGYEIVGIDRTIGSILQMGLTRMRPGRDDDLGHSLDYVAIHRAKYREVTTTLGIRIKGDSIP